MLTHLDDKDGGCLEGPFRRKAVPLIVTKEGVQSMMKLEVGKPVCFMRFLMTRQDIK